MCHTKTVLMDNLRVAHIPQYRNKANNSVSVHKTEKQDNFYLSIDDIYCTIKILGICTECISGSSNFFWLSVHMSVFEMCPHKIKMLNKCI